jgi:hypothetical protein
VEKNQLYYGDNLVVLRERIRDESVDLIYLDPPFNSRQDYNVLFAERDGTRSASQIMAFEDTWEWNMDAEAAYQEIVERGGRVFDAMRAFRTFLGHCWLARRLTTRGSPPMRRSRRHPRRNEWPWSRSCWAKATSKSRFKRPQAIAAEQSSAGQPRAAVPTWLVLAPFAGRSARATPARPSSIQSSRSLGKSWR